MAQPASLKGGDEGEGVRRLFEWKEYMRGYGSCGQGEGAGRRGVTWQRRGREKSE